MYMGHLGVALAGKGLRPRVPLWVLVLAALASDLMDALAMGLDIDPVGFFSWSHSLPGALGLAVLFALAYAAATRDGRGAALVGGAAFSHVLLDLLTSRLIGWPDGPVIGLHLYRYDFVDFALETTVILVGWRLYRRSLPEPQRGSGAAYAVVAVLLGCQLLFQMLPIT